MTRTLRLALRGLGRDWRSGRVTVVLVALTLAAAAMSTVNAFTDRITAAMAHYGAELIGADLVLESREPVSGAVLEAIRTAALLPVPTVEFPSVVLAGDETALVQVKAVGAGYPVRGVLRRGGSTAGAFSDSGSVPSPGGVWVEPRLLDRLGLEVGEELSLGDRSLGVADTLLFEPDRAGQLFQLAPRVMLNLADLETTGLVTPQSRVRYRTLLAGDPAGLKRFERWFGQEGPETVTLRTARDLRPELRGVMDRVHRFLALAALVTVLVAAAGIAISMRHYVATQLEAGALMRCLGASGSTILGQHLIQFGALGLVAGVFGSAAGFVAHLVLIRILGDWFLNVLPVGGAVPLGTGMVTALALVLGFAVPPLLRLSRVPPVHVLSRRGGAIPVSGWLAAALAGFAVAALAVWQMGDSQWGLLLVSGAVVLLGAMWGLAWLLLLLASRFAGRLRGEWWLGVARLTRNRVNAALQITAVATGVATLLVLAVTRTQVLDHWRASLPPDAPNRFLINIQADERQGLSTLAARWSIADPEYHPMIRGRWVTLNGRRVDPDSFTSPRARRLAARDFNLSFTTLLKSDNHITAGAWWGGDGASVRAFSVETGIARELGIALGDTLAFDVAGRTVGARVTSLREVAWDSFQPNFFVLGTPALLAAEPGTWITAFRLPAGADRFVSELARRFPSVTAINVDTLLDRVREMMDKAAAALSFVFAFSLLGGVVVLFAAMQANQAERREELARLRVFGALRGQLLLTLLVEFLFAGVAAGLLAALFAGLTGYLLETQVLDLGARFEPSVWLWGLVGGLAAALFAAWGARGALVRAPQRVLGNR